MRRDGRRPRPGPSGYVGPRARSTEVGADCGGARARPLRSGIPSAALIAVAFLLAACGGGSSPASVAHIGKSAPTTAVPPAAGSGGLPNLQQIYQSTLAYAGCMRSHGDPSFPDPELVDNANESGMTMGQGVDQTSPQYLSANKPCKHLLPNNGGGPTRAQMQQAMAQALKFSKCMRSHRVPSFPDPTQSGQTIHIGGGPGIDPSSPQFQAAQNDCRSLLPGGP
jgi:hypothetical protein